MLRIFIGWDQREPIAYDVAKFSLEQRASIPVDVQPIKLQDLVARGVYSRAIDPLASTEFTYQPFLHAVSRRLQRLGAVRRLRLPVPRRRRRARRNSTTRRRRSIASTTTTSRKKRPRWTARCRPATRARTGRPSCCSTASIRRRKKLTPELVNKRERRLSAPHAMGRRQRDRRDPLHLEFARRLEREVQDRHAQRRALHPRRAVVRELAGRRLRRGVARRARRDGKPRRRQAPSYSLIAATLIAEIMA